MLYKYLIIFTFFTSLSQANPAPATITEQESQFPSTECERLLGGMITLQKTFLKKNEDEYKALMGRVLSHKGVTQAQFDIIFVDLMHTYLANRERIENTPIYNGEFVSLRFLRGVTIWASSLEDIKRAIENFFHLNGFQKEWEKDPLADLSLLYFAARMAWLSDRYEVLESRSDALMELSEFDARTARHHTIIFNPDTGITIYQPEIHLSVESILAKGIKVLATPEVLGGRKFKFNNGRFFTLDDLSKPEKWVARVLSKWDSREYFLGLGDMSVRRFFPLFDIVDGYMVPMPGVCDFLSLRKGPPSEGGNFLILRELKFNAPHHRSVDIEKALTQLQSSWRNLEQAQGTSVPIKQLEILVPQRGSNTRGQLGEDYSVGPRVSHLDLGRAPHPSLFHLMKDGKRKTLTVNGRTLPVLLRQLILSKEKYESLRR